MREIRGPEIPNSVPDDLVAKYGAEARSAVRSRRSWKFRASASMRRWLGANDIWQVLTLGMLWAVILAAVGGTIAVSATHWPRQTIEAGILVAVAAVSCLVTIVVLSHRTPHHR
jgi:hypothetical protein